MTVHRFGKWIRLLADHSGIIWFGTDKGLSKLVPNPFTGFTMDDWLVHDTVRAIAEDARGGLWFGTRNGISILRGGTALTVPGERLPDPRVYALAALPEGRMLVGTANRRRFAEVLREEGRRLSRAPEDSRLSLLLIDLDGFKEINDTWGHEVGDRLLAAIGRALRGAVRSSDLVARYGGNEFAVILPMTGRDGAVHAASKILETVEGVRVPVPAGTAGITASVGVAVVAPSAVVEEEIHQLIRRADMALYGAKRAGGHRVYVDGDTGP